MSAVATVPSEARTIFFSVDSTRLLGESRRFFRSVPDALTELVQNAYRAGAHHLTVTADRATRTIRFADNGHGLDDPTRLVTFAGSGWGSAVVEPAGIGAFALFGVADSVHIRSVYGAPRAAWSLAIGADVMAAGLAGQPLSVCPEVVADNERAGLTVTAVLRADQPWPSFAPDGMTWRHFFPLSMTLLVDGVSTELDPPSIDAPVCFETPVGRLSVLKGRGALTGLPVFASHHSQLLPVWEHRAAAAALPSGRLFDERVVKDARERALINLLTYDRFSDACSFVWEVDAASGVRPQLPDRNAMLEDAALQRALGVLRGFILAATDIVGLTALFVRLAGNEPRIAKSEFDKRVKADPVAQAHRLLGVVGIEHLNPAPFLAAAGYEAIRALRMPAEAEYSIVKESDGWQTECDDDGPAYFVRPLHRFSLPKLLVGLGECVGDETEAMPATVRLACSDMKYVPALSLLLTTGLRVETLAGTTLRTLDAFWNGSGEGFNLEDVGLDVPDAGQVVGLVDVASWESAFASLRTNKHFQTLAIAACHAELQGVACSLGEYVECDWNAYEINEQRLVSDALEAVGAVLGGEAAEVAAQVAHLESLRAELMPLVLTPEQIAGARDAKLPDALVAAMATLSAAQQAARAAFKAAEQALDARMAA